MDAFDLHDLAECGLVLLSLSLMQQSARLMNTSPHKALSLLLVLPSIPPLMPAKHAADGQEAAVQPAQASCREEAPLDAQLAQSLPHLVAQIQSCVSDLESAPHVPSSSSPRVPSIPQPTLPSQPQSQPQVQQHQQQQSALSAGPAMSLRDRIDAQKQAISSSRDLSEAREQIFTLTR